MRSSSTSLALPSREGLHNKGRWFYCCTKPKEEQCGFFLWDEDAKKREEETLLSNSRTEANSMLSPETPKKERYNPKTYLLTPASEQIQRAAAKYVTPTHNTPTRESPPFEEAPYTHGFPASEEYDENERDKQYQGPPQESPSLKRKRDFTSDGFAQKAQKLNTPLPSNCESTDRSIKADSDEESCNTPSAVRRLTLAHQAREKCSWGRPSHRLQLKYV